MRRWIATAAAAVPLVGILTGTSFGAQAPRSPTEDLEFLDVRQQTEFLDTGRLGGDPSPGDAYFLRACCAEPTTATPPHGSPLAGS